MFDGHGPKGHEVSNFVRRNLPEVLLKHRKFKTDIVAAMKRAFVCEWLW